MRSRTRWGLRGVGVGMLWCLLLAGLGVYLGLVFVWVFVPVLRWMVAG